MFSRNEDQEEITSLEVAANVVNRRVDNLYVQIDYYSSLLAAKKRRLDIELQQKKTVKQASLSQSA